MSAHAVRALFEAIEAGQVSAVEALLELELEDQRRVRWDLRSHPARRTADSAPLL